MIGNILRWALALSLFAFGEGFTQGIAWTRWHDGTHKFGGNSIAPAPGGGYALLGYNSHPYAEGYYQKDFFFVRTDSMGEAIWQKSYGFGDDEVGTSVLPTPEGGYLLAGSTNSFLPKDYNALVFKIDSLGTVLWHNRYGSGGDESCDFLGSASDGGYFLGGHRLESGIRHPWILKIDPVGKQTWEIRPSMPNFVVGGIKGLPAGRALVMLFHFSGTDTLYREIDSAGNLLGTLVFSDGRFWPGGSRLPVPDGSYIEAGPLDRILLPAPPSSQVSNPAKGFIYLRRVYPVTPPEPPLCENRSAVVSAPLPATGMALGPDGTAWTSHAKGVLKRVGQDWFGFDSTNSGLPADSLTGIAADSRGRIWMATGRSGLIEYDGKDWKTHDKSNSPLPSDSLSAVATDSSDHIWVRLKAGQGWIRFDGGTQWTLVPVARPTLVFKDRSGDVWSIRDERLVFQGKGQDSALDSDGPGEWKSLKGIGRDRDGNLVLSSANSLFKWNRCKDPKVTQSAPDVGMDGSGNFVLVWRETGDWSNTGIFAQRYLATGAKVGGRIQVDGSEPGADRQPRISVNAEGSFAIAWRDSLIPEERLLLRTFDREGRAFGPAHVVDKGYPHQFYGPSSFTANYAVFLGDAGDLYINRTARISDGNNFKNTHLKVERLRLEDTTVSASSTYYNAGRTCAALTSVARPLSSGGYAAILDTDGPCDGVQIRYMGSDGNVTSVTELGKGRTPDMQISKQGILAASWNDNIQFIDLSGAKPPSAFANSGQSSVRLAINAHGDVLAAGPRLDGDTVFADLYIGSKPSTNRIPLGSSEGKQFAIALNGAKEALFVFVEGGLVKFRFLDARTIPGAIRQGTGDRGSSFRLQGRTLIYRVGTAEAVRVDLYTYQGRFRARLLDGRQETGLGQVNLAGYPSGLYFLKSSGPGRGSSRIMAIILP